MTGDHTSAHPPVALPTAGGPSFSFELFPPTVRRVEPLAPSFVSVTYGAGGSSRDRPGEGLRVGVAHATAMARRLLAEGAPGLHHITLNRSSAAVRIHRDVLGLAHRAPARPEFTPATAPT